MLLWPLGPQFAHTRFRGLGIFNLISYLSSTCCEVCYRFLLLLIAPSSDSIMEYGSQTSSTISQFHGLFAEAVEAEAAKGQQLCRLSLKMRKL